MNTIYQIAADTVLLIHASIVLFIVLGLVLVIIGGFLQWKFVRYRWFRFECLLGCTFVYFTGICFCNKRPILNED